MIRLLWRWLLRPRFVRAAAEIEARFSPGEQYVPGSLAAEYQRFAALLRAFVIETDHDLRG